MSVWMALATVGWAHPGATALAGVPAPDGCEPEVWLIRARASGSDGLVDEGLSALQRARACGADLVDVALARAVLVRDRDPALARGELDFVLAERPDHAGALALRARLAAAEGRADDALRDLDHLGASTTVDDRLLAARLLADAGRREDALARLDAGPPVPAIVAAAVDLEVALGRPESALGRLDALPRAPWVDALAARVDAP